MRRRLLLVALVALLAAVPAGAVISPTFRMTIAHVVKNCHVWTTPMKQLGAVTRISVRRGALVVIRIDCPMDFDFVQAAGTRLQLGSRRTFGGQTRTILFRRAGVYRVRATNIQTPEERGLVMLGPPNTLIVTIVVK